MQQIIVTPPGESIGTTLARVRRSYPGALAAYRMLEVDWPVAIRVIARLARYLTESVQVGDGSLLQACVRRGLQDYNAHWSARDRCRLNTFVGGLTGHLAGYLCVEVHHDGCDPWRLSAGRPLSLWMRDNAITGQARLHVRTADPAGIDREVALRRIGQYLYPAHVRAMIDT